MQLFENLCTLTFHFEQSQYGLQNNLGIAYQAMYKFASQQPFNGSKKHLVAKYFDLDYLCFSTFAV